MMALSIHTPVLLDRVVERTVTTTVMWSGDSGGAVGQHPPPLEPSSLCSLAGASVAGVRL